MFGGVSWNRICVIDMLGTDLGEMALLQKVACWLIFVTQWHLASDEIKLFLDCLTCNRGQVGFAGTPTDTGGAQEAGSLSHSQSASSVGGMASGHSSSSNLTNYIPSAEDFAYTENTLVSMLTCNVSVCHFAAPNKLDTAYCLKISRRILNSARWKMNSNAPKSFFEFVTGSGGSGSGKVTKTSSATRVPSSDASLCTSAAQVMATLRADREYYYSSSLDEYFSLLNIFSILCRTIIMAYNAMDKHQTKDAQAPAPVQQQSVSMHELMLILPPGMKSDIANSFLEGLEYALNNWKKRMLCIQFGGIDFYSPLAAFNSPEGGGKSGPKEKCAVSYARKRYLSNASGSAAGKSPNINLPLVGVFYAISESLPIVRNVQDALLRMMLEFRNASAVTKA
jgi:hypothetical protein